MDKLFTIDNASLLLRLIYFVTHNPAISLEFLTVIYEDSSWIIRLKSSTELSCHQECDLEAFLQEISAPCHPQPRLSQVLLNLERGRSPVEVMNRYKIVVVSHGAPSALEVEIFRRDFIARLGYTPCALV